MAVIIHTENSNGWGGQEMRILGECRGMQQRGHTAVIAARPESGIFEKADLYGVKAYPLKLAGPSDFAGISGIRKLVHQLHADIVSTHSSGDSWCAGIGARLAGCKVVRTRHLSIPVKKVWSSKLLYGKIPHAVVTTGQALADALVADGLVSSDKALSIPTGIDTKHFDISRFDKADVRQKLGLAETDTVLGMVAMFRRMKGHDVLLHAAKSVLKQHPDIRILLIGDAPTGNPVRAEMEALATQLGIRSQIVFAGFFSDVAEPLSAMDVFILPSVMHEGVPQSISQAMSMRLPVVSTRVGSIPEQVLPGRTGWLVDPGNSQALAAAINEAVAMRDVWPSYGENARERAISLYGLDAMLDRTEELYERLLQRQSK